MRWSKERVAEFRRRQYEAIAACLDGLISATPTGPVRELVTSANILLMQAQKQQGEADALEAQTNG